MSAYTVRWVTYAEQQRDSLPADARRELNKLLDLLTADPRGHGTYSKRNDQWIATFGGGWGLVIYTVEDRWITITMLRVYLGRMTHAYGAQVHLVEPEEGHDRVQSGDNPLTGHDPQRDRQTRSTTNAWPLASAAEPRRSRSSRMPFF